MICFDVTSSILCIQIFFLLFLLFFLHLQDKSHNQNDHEKNNSSMIKSYDEIEMNRY